MSWQDEIDELDVWMEQLATQADIGDSITEVNRRRKEKLQHHPKSKLAFSQLADPNGHFVGHRAEDLMYIFDIFFDRSSTWNP